MPNDTKSSMSKPLLKTATRVMMIIIPTVMPAIIGDKASFPTAIVVHVNVNV